MRADSDSGLQSLGREFDGSGRKAGLNSFRGFEERLGTRAGGT